MLELPDHLSPEALHSTAVVFPVHVDRLRTCVQQKLGWSPFSALQFFLPFKRRAQVGLSVGELLTALQSQHGDGAALVVLRALRFFANEKSIRRAHRRAFQHRHTKA